jgi:putative transposase
MSRKYKIRDQSSLYFVTFTVIHWIDVFTRNEYRQIFMDSVKYCLENKGLQVYAYCIMPSHVHMIISSESNNPLEGIIRDLKSFTSRHIRKALEDTNQVYESRREWMLRMMYNEGKFNNNNKDFQFWQQHSHPIELTDNNMMQTLEYIHNNPVAAGFVEGPEEWLYSSARDYYGTGKGLLDLVLIQ